MENIILVGGGGHCKSCIDVIEQENKYNVVGIVDNKERLNEKVSGYNIFATDEDLPELIKEYDNFLITLGQIKNPLKRVNLFKLLKKLRAVFPIIISPSAYVSGNASLGEGTIVMHHALINVDVEIGRNCIINNKALIDHDVKIGDHCHISTATVINGGVKIGPETFLGSNAVIKECIEIGRSSIIGAGVSVLKDISPESVITLAN